MNAQTQEITVVNYWNSLGGYDIEDVTNGRITASTANYVAVIADGCRIVYYRDDFEESIKKYGFVCPWVNEVPMVTT